MELVITTQELEPLPIQNEGIVNKPLGFLTSKYKLIVRRNFGQVNSHSIFGIRQRIKSRRFNSSSNIETILKVSLFLILSFIIIS